MRYAPARPRPAAACPRRGFSLIELVIVLLVLSLIGAISLGTFRGARSGAQDRAVSVVLSTAQLEARTRVTPPTTSDPNGLWSTSTGDYINDIPGMSATDGKVSTPTEVSVKRSVGSQLLNLAASGGRGCLVLIDDLRDPAKEHWYFDREGAEKCDASRAGNGGAWLADFGPGSTDPLNPTIVGIP